VTVKKTKQHTTTKTLKVL